MKLKFGYLLREVAGSHIVVPMGDNVANLDGVITLNEVGAFLWEKLADETDEAALLTALLEEYDVDEATAKADVSAFIAKAKENDLVE